MSANAFRSPLMQQIVAASRSQHRPPLVLPHFGSSSTSKTSPKNNYDSQSTSPSRQMSTLAKHAKGDRTPKVGSNSLSSLQSIPMLHNNTVRNMSASTTITEDNNDLNLGGLELESKGNHTSFQTTIQTRRTPANYSPIDFSVLPQLQESIARAIECATYAPNHHRTEPTTYYRIIANTEACNKLMDICYNVALCRNIKKKSRKEAEINAEAKKNKWQNTIGGYIVVCVGNQPVQDDECDPNKPLLMDNSEQDLDYWYDTMPMRPPQTERQLEDYASACASIQNILLSLHSEGWGSKWATGPVIRCRAFRSLVGCKSDDAIAGLLMVGSPKIIPREWRRRREFNGDVMRDL